MLAALQRRYAGGEVQVVGLSCDSVYSLKAWAEQLGGLGYPLCSDFWPHGAIARAYGVFDEEVGRPERAIIVIDALGICRHIDVHQLREAPDEDQIAEQLDRLSVSG